MKKLITILFFALLAITVNAQSLFKPVPKDLFTQNKGVLKAPLNASVWLWRISAEVTAVELNWNKDTKQFDSQPLSSAGPAIGYRHFTALNYGTPYNDFGVNLAILLGTDITHISPAAIKIALLINALQYINVGADWNFGNNKPGILIGASINF
jgi:hypothetical protein